MKNGGLKHSRCITQYYSSAIISRYGAYIPHSGLHSPFINLSPRLPCTSHTPSLPPFTPSSLLKPHSFSSSQANPFGHRRCMIGPSPSSLSSPSCSSLHPACALLRCCGGSVRQAAGSAHSCNRNTTNPRYTSSNSGTLLLLPFALPLLDGCSSDARGGGESEEGKREGWVKGDAGTFIMTQPPWWAAAAPAL